MGLLFAKQDLQHSTIYIQRHNNKHLKNNQIQTTKYTWYTFLPKSIILQFKRPANLVYLCSAIIQLFPAISSLNPITAIAPFAFVLTISLIREAYQDYKRSAKDHQINSRKATLLHQTQFIETNWSSIQIGDIIKVKNQQPIPADIVLIFTTQQHNLCFVQTANLDGQNNLKTKFSCFQAINSQPQQLSKLKGKIIADLPNSNLHQFNGTIQLQGMQQKQIKYENFLLRETVLKNAQQILGIVVYIGEDTKILQNQQTFQNKISNLQKKVNIIQTILLIILFLLSASITIGFNQIHYTIHHRNQLYQYPSQVQNNTVEIIFIYFSSFLLLTFIIPISLNVSIEVIKGFLGIFLSFDRKMHSQNTNKKCNINNVSIIQQLGSIDYILTDKTGTLTTNQMIFKFATIDQSNYTSEQLLQNITELKSIHSFHTFWISLIICQDVVYDSNSMKYQGSSPDQVCFVTFAQSLGYQFVKRTKNTLEFLIFSENVVFQLLRILHFDSRKRMSVIVRDTATKQIFIYTKGADSCIFSNSLPSTNRQHLKTNVDNYAKQGYRTLLFSYRKLQNEEFIKLQEEYQKINQLKANSRKSNQQIEQLQSKLLEQYQSNLILLGSTAIEDRLQDEVPQTIQRFQNANISVMMITGDKLQTAQNIGLSANFIKSISKIYHFRTDITIEQINTLTNEIIHYHTNQKDSHISIIIQGIAINLIISNSFPKTTEMFRCVSSVIFCRSSPKQKASIVKFVKQKLGGITLAIGDGGNDVGMIQVANVGIGILGKQGNSASAASDFSISQFRHLDRLVLHHGRWFYYRLSYFFVYYGWKSLTMTLLLYYFMIDSAFTAFPGLSQPFITVYNILIGLGLVVYFAIYEQDINDDQYQPAYQLLPIFYRETKQLNLFSSKRYFAWSVFAMVIATFIYLSTKYGIGSFHSIDSSGHVGGYIHCSEALAISLSIIVISILITDIKTYTWFSTLFIIGFITILITVLFFIIQNFVYISKMSNYSILAKTSFRYWLVIFLNCSFVYIGKLLIDTIYRQRGETLIEKTIRERKNIQSKLIDRQFIL